MSETTSSSSPAPSVLGSNAPGSELPAASAPVAATRLTPESPLQFGLDTFGDMTHSLDGTPLHSAQVIRNVVGEGQLAEEVGVDFFGIGEHHRSDFAVSAPEMILAALASTTEKIALGTAVTVLSSDDAVRVYERFATLDALSSGRAEMVVGRGSFTESFPLFGYDLNDYEMLFEEKLGLLRRAMAEKPLHWEGRHRRPLTGQQLMPKTEKGLAAWIGVGGSPESVVRAVSHQIPMALAIIGGDPARFRPFVDLYHRASDESGTPRMPLGVHSPGFIAETDERARELLFPHWKANMDNIGRSRGWPPANRNQFMQEVLHGSLYVGSPETVAQKIARTARILGPNRFDMKYAVGTLAHEHLMDSIRLYGEQVIPRVRELLAESA